MKKWKQKKDVRIGNERVRQKRTRGRSTQELLRIRTFTRYGLETEDGELIFFQISPVNLAVLSKAAVEIKIRHLMMVLSAAPDIEMVCADAYECFDDNKIYLQNRYLEETNPKVRELLKRDREMLDNMQSEMATARQFMIIVRCRKETPDQVFQTMNRIQKLITEQGFELRRMGKNDIKRFLAIYFGATMYGDQMPDGDGEQFFAYDVEEAENNAGDRAVSEHSSYFIGKKEDSDEA